MCGRFSLFVALKELAALYGLTLADLEFFPRFNVAPSSLVPIIADFGENRFALARWGLVPSWAKDEKVGNKMINARAETVATKPAFRRLFKEKRCLVPASGFYEWSMWERSKHPYFISKKDGRPFVFAGLYDAWQPTGGPQLLSYTIITTTANELILPVHNRMPVILDPLQAGVWLDRKTSTETLESLLAPYDSAKMVMYQVSKLCNSPLVDTPDCIKPE